MLGLGQNHKKITPLGLWDGLSAVGNSAVLTFKARRVWAAF